MWYVKQLQDKCLGEKDLKEINMYKPYYMIFLLRSGNYPEREMS
jgi:hypothetical protein